MKITECLWLDEFVDKIIRKHHVYPEEVEEMFSREPLIRRLEGGHVKGEDLFIAFGTTNPGRYLSALFVGNVQKLRQTFFINFFIASNAFFFLLRLRLMELPTTASALAIPKLRPRMWITP